MSDIQDEPDESTLTASEKLSYIMEVRDIFGDDAAEEMAERLGVFLPAVGAPGQDDATPSAVLTRPQP